jgi:hypothetical protein
MGATSSCDSANGFWQAFVCHSVTGCIDCFGSGSAFSSLGSPLSPIVAHGHNGCTIDAEVHERISMLMSLAAAGPT